MQVDRAYRDSGDTAIQTLADSQHGVVSHSQLLAADVSKDRIHRLSRNGWLVRLHRGVYIAGHAPITLRGRWMAAVLACGEGAVLSHGHAAALHSVGTTPRGAIHVSAPTRHHLPGIRCHHGAPDDSTVIDGVPVTGLARTILDRAEQLSLQRIRTMLDAAVHQQSLDARDLRNLIAASPGRKTRALAAALDATADDAPWTQSELERRFLELVRAAGLPEPRTNRIIEGELIDVIWPDRRLIVELDGWDGHRTKTAFVSDRRRDAKLQAAGYRVVRFTWQDVKYDAPTVTSRLRALLGAASGR